MACPDPESLAQSGALDPAVEAHLAACAPCAKIIEVLRAGDDAHELVGEPKGPRDPEPGDTIGRYVIVGRLGAGGMGVVMAAYDPRLDRTVALKSMRADRANPALAKRLEREAQALAKLAHPHLVRIYDAGVEGGRLYLAMELVDGVTLRDWLAEAPRSTADIVRVFLEIAAGLSAVHAAGFVHRDIKPDNVLVDRTGVARVADFGLVSRGDSEAANEPAPSSPPQASSMTEPFTAVGTPAYMAPEQRQGGAVDARTDQWSWGTALAEALGDRKLDARTRAVIARATAADPAARFTDITAAARALAPRKPMWPWLAAGVAVAGAATISIVVSARGGGEDDPCLAAGADLASAWHRERGAIAAAFEVSGHPSWRARLDATERGAQSLASLWSDASRSVCRTAKARRVVAERACLDQQLATAVALFAELARADRARPDDLGALDRPQIDQPSGAKAVAGSGRTLVDQAPLAITRLARPATCLDASVLELVRAPAAVAVPLAAELASFKARVAVRAPGELVDGVASLADRARLLGATQLEGETRLLLGELESKLRRDAAATATLEAAAQAAARARDDRVAALARLLQAGQAALLVGDRDRAATLGDVAAAAVERAGNPAELRGQLANIRGGIAFGRGDFVVALTHYEAAVAGRAEAFGPDHPTVAAARNNVALVLGKLGRDAEARAASEAALASLERTLGSDHPDLAATLNTLGTHAADDKRYDDALRLFERTRALRLAAFGPDHPDVTISENNLGKLAKLRGDPRAAIAHYARSVEIIERTLGKDVRELALPLSGLGAAHADLEEWDRARGLLDRAIAITEVKRGADHPALISILITYANVRVHQGDADAQRAALDRALAIAKAKLGAEHVQTKELEQLRSGAAGKPRSAR